MIIVSKQRYLYDLFREVTKMVGILPTCAIRLSKYLPREIAFSQIVARLVEEI